MSQDRISLSEREDFLHNMVYAYFRWKYVMLATFVALLVMVFFAGYLMTPTWKAEVHLLAEPVIGPANTSFPDPTRPKPQQSAEMYSEHVIRILEGKEMAYAVVKKFGLDEIKRRKAEEPRTLRERFMVGLFGTIEAVVSGIVQLFGGGEDRGTDWVDEAAEDFRDGLFSWLSIELVSDTDIVELGVYGESPELANDIAAFMIERLREQLAGVSAVAGEAALNAFGTELGRVTRQLEEAEEALRAYRESSHAGDPSDLTRLKTMDLARLGTEYSRLLAEKAAIEAQLGAVAGGTAGSPPPSSDRIAGNAVIQQLRVNLNNLRTTMASRLEDMTEEHPEVITARAQIRQAEAELRTEIENLLHGIDNELHSRKAEIEAAQKDLSLILTREFEDARLSRNVESLRQLRRELQEHIDAMTVTAQSGLGTLSIKVIDRAFVSPVATPDSPMWILVALIALVFAGGVAVVLPPFLEYWRDPIRGPADLVPHGLVTLGVIPKAPRRRPEEQSGGSP